MRPHKFAIGQIVRFTESSWVRHGGAYEVMRALPPDATDTMTYHVKSVVEKFARTAKEDEIIAADPQTTLDPGVGRR